MPAKDSDQVGGPFLTGAFFCEKILQEKDGALTPVRIIDTVILEVVTDTRQSEGLPEGTPIKLRRQLSALLSFKSGDATGKRAVRIACKSLSIDVTLPIVLQGGHHGANLIINMGLEMPAGVHWFSVLLSRKLVTKIPLRAIIQHRQADMTTVESQTTSQESTN